CSVDCPVCALSPRRSGCGQFRIYKGLKIPSHFKPMELQLQPNRKIEVLRDRGRERRLVSAPPPSEPDWRFSPIRPSRWWFTSFEDCVLSQRLLRVLATPARQSMHLARVCGPASSSLVLCDVVVSAE